jgi:hypothetical protein
MVSYGIQAFAAFSLYALFALASTAVWLLVRWAFPDARFGPALVGGSAIAGPALLAILLWLTLWALPGLLPAAYIGITALVPATIVLLQRRALITTLRDVGHAAASLRIAVLWLVVAVAVLSAPLLLAVQLFFLPLHGNDPLEYMQLGRAFHGLRDASIYPILSSELTGGFIAPWTHPPSYGVLIALAFFLQGSGEIAGAAKLIGLWFAMATAVFGGGIVFAHDRRLSWRAIVTPLFVLTIPVYFQLVQSAHVDAMRIATFTLACAATILALQQASRSAFLAAGIAISLAMLSHSIGLLAPMIALPLMAVAWQRGLKSFIGAASIVVGVVVLTGLPHYLRNTMIFGNPIQDSVPAWEIPELEVKQFLKTSRGLETLADRIYHGVLMPFTRTDEFGWLPSLLAIILLAALLIAIRRGPGAAVSAIYRVRHSDIAAQLGLAIGGFFTLVLLTALAGSELAIKNARYLLTIAPLVVVFLMVVIGKILPEGRLLAGKLAGAARTVLRPVTPLLPARLHRWQTAQTSEPNSLAGVPLAFLVVSALLLCGLVQALATLRATYANAAVYVGAGVPGWSRFTEAERMKRDGSVLPDAIVERIVRERVGKDDTVLVFRQASFGFYRAARFRFHLEPGLVDLFRLSEPKQLAQRLADLGIRWLYLPNFALPEVENSAFGRLLRDPALCRPVLRMQGWALYEVGAQGFSPALTRVAGADSMKSMAGSLAATTEEGSGTVDGRDASLTFTADGAAQLQRKRGMVKQLGRWDAVVQRPLRTGLDPDTIDAADLRITDQGRILINARLSGKGLAEIAIEYTQRSPADDMSDAMLFPTSGAVDGFRSSVAREILWSGVLSETAREVGGWFMPSLLPRPGSDSQGARLVFRLRDGDVLRVHSWQATGVSYDGSPASSEQVRQAYLDGWLVAGSPIPGREETDLRPLASPKDAEAITGLLYERPSTRSVALSPPPFWLPGSDGGSQERARRDAMLAGLLREHNLALIVQARLTGSGSVEPQVAFLCATPDAGAGAMQSGLAQWLGRTAPEAQRVHRIDQPPLYLHRDSFTTQRWAIRLPCVPSVVRLVLRSKFSRFETMEEFIRDPDQAQRGAVGVEDVSMLLGPLVPNPVVRSIGLERAAAAATGR